MRTLLLCLMTTVLMTSCDPNADSRIGDPDRFRNANNNGSGSGGGGNGAGLGNNTGAGSTTDAPLDGGLSLLLLAGSAYGIKRFAGKKQAAKE